MARSRGLALGVAVAFVVGGCAVAEPPDPPASEPRSLPASIAPGASSAPSPAPSPSRVERRGETPVVVGPPIPDDQLVGRIVFDDFEDLYTMNADGTDLRTVAGRAGPEFDGSWSPDGGRIVYRDSRRGINENDEIYVVNADGSEPRALTDDPANDWGPDWSPDGEWIVFNSDRDGRMSGYLVRPEGSDLRRIQADAWLEYPSFSPDGRRVAFMASTGSDYDVFVADVATGASRRLTDSPGSDGWPAWSPDGSTIAFKSQRDDCLRAPPDQDCWRLDEPGEHDDIWLMDPDGSNQRRLTPEHGGFVAWSPDSSLLLVSGHTLFVVRPDGTGRREIRPEGLPYAPGGMPDWTASAPAPGTR